MPRGDKSTRAKFGDNVHKLTPEDGRKGGIASGIAKRKKIELREILDDVLSRIEQGESKDNATQIVEKAVQEAKHGDYKFAEMIFKATGTLKETKVEVDSDNFTIKIE